MIPVFEPDIGEEEIEAVVAALRRGEISGSFGSAIKDFERNFARFCGVRHGIAVSSGTAALHVAVAALDLHPGEEVLVSASTNVATALAVYHNGLVPVPVDSEETTWNLNLDLIDCLITPRTRAILPVHLFGHPVDMQRVMKIATQHGLVVIEDCAESHGATCRGRMTGSFGAMGCFSFYANKIITTGEGGMVVTEDDALAERIRLLRNLAFSEPRFRHDLPGFNFRMTGYQAAMGTAQLRKIDQVVARKREIAGHYDKYLGRVEWLHRPQEEQWARHVYWMYGIVVAANAPVTRDELMSFLRQRGIDTRTFFCPMNQQPFLRRLKTFRDVPCPVADKLWENGLYLPSSTTLSADQIRTICETVAAAGARR